MSPFTAAVFLTPFAGGSEILKAKANRINLAMAAGALGFLHVGGEFLPLREGLAVQARKLRHIGRCRGRWRVQQMTQHPGPALHGAALRTVAAHRVHRGHSQESSARRIFRHVDFPIVITRNPFQAVVRRQQTIDDDIVAFEKILQLSLTL